MGLPRRLVCAWLAMSAVGCFSEPGRAPQTNNSTSTTTGSTDSSSNNQTTCTPSAERCDGLDNDCDGDIDNGFDVGTECREGLGVCASSGALVCNGAADDVLCDAVALEPTSDELCGDLLDNDCDGAIDEGFPELGDDCVSGIGVCEVAGVLVCAPDGVGTVCGGVALAPPEPEEVSCDGLDNDCDGTVDEGCDDDLDGACDIAMTLVSPGGDGLCPGGGGDCDDTDDEVYPGAPGLCDGKDNDCAGGVDEIKRGRVRTFTLQDFAAQDLVTSPIQAVATDTGYCIHMTGHSAGARSVTRGVYRSSSAALSAQTDLNAGESRVADVAFSGSRCGSLVIEEDGDATLDARAYWWTYGFTSQGDNRVVNDGITHIAPSWDASLVFARGVWVVGWSTTSGTAASYTTIRENFNGTDTAAAPMTIGINGKFPELGLHPGAKDLLFASNFGNINVHEATVGSSSSAVASMTLAGAATKSVVVFNTIAGDAWSAVRDGSLSNRWEVRRVTPTPAFGAVIEVPSVTSVEPQDYLSRNPFVGGPNGAVWFLDGVDESVASLTDDGAGGFDVEIIEDDLATGHVLTGRQASPTVTEILWLTDPGTAARDAAFEVVDYTCY